MSRDGRWVVTAPYPVIDRLRLVPTGPGVRKELPRGSIQEFSLSGFAAFTPDGERLYFFGRAAAEWQLFVQDVRGADPRPL